MNENKVDQELLFTIVIPDFITQIQVSAARRPIYYEQGGKYEVPPSKKKHVFPNGKGKFVWLFKKLGSKTKVVLCDSVTEEPIIKNARVAGKPKFVQIKGNDFYSGFSTPHQRILIINSIKDNFRSHFKEIKRVESYPIYLEFTIYNELNIKTSKDKKMSQDLDNQAYAYVKSSQDLMKEVKIIEDDNLSYIRKVSYEFIEAKDKQLVIKAYKYNKDV